VFDLLMLMAHKQSYVTVMLNKCHYSSDMFDMFTVILHNTFKTTTPLMSMLVFARYCICSFTYNRKRKGPYTEPCGMPQVILSSLERTLSVVVNWNLLA